MSETGRDTAIHISSAVVQTIPKRMSEVTRRIETISGAEVYQAVNGKIVVVFEAADSNAIGANLAAINLFDGVLSATMVFEQIENSETLGGSS